MSRCRCPWKWGAVKPPAPPAQDMLLVQDIPPAASRSPAVRVPQETRRVRVGMHMNAGGPETGQQAGDRAWVMSQAGLRDLAGTNYHVSEVSFKKQHPKLDQTGQVDTLTYHYRPVPTHVPPAFPGQPGFLQIRDCFCQMPNTWCQSTKSQFSL